MRAAGAAENPMPFGSSECRMGTIPRPQIAAFPDVADVDNPGARDELRVNMEPGCRILHANRGSPDALFYRARSGPAQTVKKPPQTIENADIPSPAAIARIRSPNSRGLDSCRASN